MAANGNIPQEELIFFFAVFASKRIWGWYCRYTRLLCVSVICGNLMQCDRGPQGNCAVVQWGWNEKAQFWSSVWGWTSWTENTEQEASSKVFDGCDNATSQIVELLLFFGEVIIFTVTPAKCLPSPWSGVSDGNLFSLQQCRNAFIWVPYLVVLKKA